jgi:tight adherence protein B
VVISSLSLPLLRWLVLAGLGCGAAVFSWFALLEGRAFIWQRASSHLAELTREVSFLRLQLSARHIALAQLGLFLLALGALLAKHPLLASLAALPALGVKPWLQVQRAKRVSALEQQLDGWMVGLASALRATPALGEGIEYSLTLVANPLHEELDFLVKEQRLGTPLDEALVRMGQRIRSRTLQTALGTLRIGQRTGGEISKILERSAGTLREMARLEGVIRVKTAEGKAQAYVLGLMPFPLVALFQYINPEFLLPLVEKPRGHVVIAAAVVAWLLSLVATRRILRVDI